MLRTDDRRSYERPMSSYSRQVTCFPLFTAIVFLLHVYQRKGNTGIQLIYITNVNKIQLFLLLQALHSSRTAQEAIAGDAENCRISVHTTCLRHFSLCFLYLLYWRKVVMIEFNFQILSAALSPPHFQHAKNYHDYTLCKANQLR